MHSHDLNRQAPTSWFGYLVGASNALASAWILVLMALLLGDVVMRGLFNNPISGVNEILTISIVVMLYLQIPQALRDNRHTRSDAFYSTIERRSPKTAALLEALFALAGGLLMVAVVMAGIPKVIAAWNGSFVIGTRGVFSVPEWPLNLLIVFGCVLMGIQFLLIVGRTLQAAFKP